MNRALLWKELRALSPFAVFVLLLAGLDAAWRVLFAFPDQQPLSRTFDELVVGDLAMGGMLILSVGLAQGLLMREHDERTVELLDGLPVTRTQVFAVKVLAAFAILCFLPVARIGVAGLLQALSATSVESGLHLPLLARAAGVHAIQIYGFLAFSLLAAWLRRPAWLLLPLLWTWREAAPGGPLLSLLDPFQLSASRVLSPGGELPLRPLLAWSTAATGCLALSWLLFLGAGDTLVRLRDRLLGGVPGRLLIGAAVIATVAVLALFGDVPLQDRPERVRYRPWAATTVTTERYAFSFPTDRSRQIEPLLARADAVDAQVRAILGAEAGSRVTVDLTGGRAGDDAFWDKVRLDISGLDHLDALLAQLGAGTARVYVDRLSDRRAREQLLQEGIATWIELRLAAQPRAAEAVAVRGAFLHERSRLGFDELLDDDLLRVRYDAEAVGPLGLLFVSALVEQHGEAAPGQLLRAFGRPDAPTDVDVLTRWNDAFQAAGFSLEATIDRWLAAMGRIAATHRATWDTVPSPRGAVRVEDGHAVSVELLEPPPRGIFVTCRFRLDPNTDPTRWRTTAVQRDRTCRVPTEWTGAARFDWQMGVQYPPGHTTWERWQTAEVGR